MLGGRNDESKDHRWHHFYTVCETISRGNQGRETARAWVVGISRRLGDACRPGEKAAFPARDQEYRVET